MVQTLMSALRSQEVKRLTRQTTSPMESSLEIELVLSTRKLKNESGGFIPVSAETWQCTYGIQKKAPTPQALETGWMVHSPKLSLHQLHQKMGACSL